jgi:hypothetical protein
MNDEQKNQKWVQKCVQLQINMGKLWAGGNVDKMDWEWRKWGILLGVMMPDEI